MPMDPDNNAQANGPWTQGMEVIANYNFPGKSHEDLPFQKGDILFIVRSTRDPNWYRAKDSTGKEGMIPATYVQPRTSVPLHAMPWYHGRMTREEAERLLKFQEDGVFLIRDSVHYHGDYTLSVVYEGRVDHYRVLARNRELEVDGGDCTFHNLIELVQHYKTDADGLCTRLVRPVKKDGESFATVSVQDFQSSGWVIKMDNASEWEKIGKGEFGNVYKGVYKGQAVAIKQLKDKDKAEQTFLKEASVMTSLRHANLVQLIGVVLSDEFFLVTEFMGKGNLVEYLRSRGRSVITKKDQINFATDTCAAMDYLESKNLVHRDLAARNVLVHENGTAKVSDFGLAKFEDFSTDGGKFPIKWTAPEALRDNAFTNKSDMWSFGILLWEIYSFGRVPYPRIPLADVVVHVERGYRMEAPECCPPEVYTIMKKAWALKPDDRPTFHLVLEELNALRSVRV
ncbi:tyrosine-protein kinase CSK-like isoform X1 [Haliotis cracherodii]|uniref:tyrosine-protein kinase CSK-like isoform X1 n=1 Tax=Haliotis cracherodii TaxID=6455 RepID=UPI0039E9F043